MHSLFFIGVCLLCGCANAAAPNTQQEPVEIPLDQIWAHNMPGTRDVRALEPDVFGEGAKRLSRQELVRREKASLLFRIGSAIPIAREGVPASSGFAVTGTGIDALRNAQVELGQSRKSGQSFSRENNLSIFFFSNAFGAYVHLQQVERRDKLIRVSYRFVPHPTKQMTAHFAIIPLGKLSAGKYRVEFVSLPMEKKYIDQGISPVDPKWHRWVVCRSFTFTVIDDG